MGFARAIKAILLFDLWAGVFLFQMIVYWGDKIAWKLLRYDKKTRYVRRGACQRTGMCCQSLAIELPASWIRRPWMVRFFHGWYRMVHRFEPAGPPQGKLLPLTCAHLKDGNLCTIYPFRPKLCREYPFVTLFGHIELHRGCGFWFMEREKVGTFEEKLQREEHEGNFFKRRF
jgi:Fe-S-cluster containining protein